jgi:hypothetical protein
VVAEALATITAELVTFQEMLEQTLDFIVENLEMQDYYYDNILLGSKSNAVSIHFDPKDDDKSNDYVSLLMGELALRNLSPSGNLEHLQRRLKSSLKTEQMVRLHQATIKHM